MTRYTDSAKATSTPRRRQRPTRARTQPKWPVRTRPTRAERPVRMKTTTAGKPPPLKRCIPPLTFSPYPHTHPATDQIRRTSHEGKHATPNANQPEREPARTPTTPNANDPERQQARTRTSPNAGVRGWQPPPLVDTITLALSSSSLPPLFPLFFLPSILSFSSSSSCFALLPSSLSPPFPSPSLPPPLLSPLYL
jgi:hypothetical protein